MEKTKKNIPFWVKKPNDLLVVFEKIVGNSSRCFFLVQIFALVRIVNSHFIKISIISYFVKKY